MARRTSITTQPQRGSSGLRLSSERGAPPVRMVFNRTESGEPQTPSNLPTLDIPEVTHIGTLDKGDKRNYSLEGPLLSVSNVPERWRKIAKLGGLPEHKIEGGTFVDRHALSSDQWKNVVSWAKDAGHVTPAWEYAVNQGYDDELGDDYVTQHSSLADARTEARDVGSRVEARRVVKATGDDARQMPGEDYALMHAAKQAGMRGVWWSDDDDGNWSAPRGGVFHEDDK